ncbi:MAG: ATP-binding protein [Methanomassiliicoccaceae archaeon]|nr:ATP-binding protein [Methanomassiliicoccaceae archaeon]
MEIKRDRYLNRLIERKWNGSVKVVTGIRRCGKSYLLFNLFRDHLISGGVNSENIIAIALDDKKNEALREPDALYSHIIELTADDSKKYYVLLDEIQYVKGFEDVVNGLRHMQNLDVYVTGSNSKFLSTDIITEFRGRGDEVRVYPLSFSEFRTAFPENEAEAWKLYMTFGGMPELLTKNNDKQRSAYLKNLFNSVYLKDIFERNDINLADEMGLIINTLCSSVGSLTNPAKISNTLRTSDHASITDKTVNKYLEILEESFLFEKAERYDVKGRKYLNTPYKYFAVDVGLRNARLNFRQQEPTHIIENIVYNELRSREYSVDVGIVESRVMRDSESEYKQLEIDFIVNEGSSRYYIQVAYASPEGKKRERELRPLLKVKDSFKKILVVGDDVRPWTDDNGIVTIGLMQFLLDENSLDL